MAAGLALPGCGESLRSAGAATRPADTQARGASQAADEWAPLPVPADFDRNRAALPLAQVPDDPPAPDKSAVAAGDELPRQAIRHLEEARRLFREQRYSETVRELERALRYNLESPEAHRLTAMALLLSGKDESAEGAANQALALMPNDLVGHYILGRAAEKAQNTGEALREYRVALKSDAAPGEESYRLLVHYYLGNLLFEEKYCRAAVEQLSAFEAGLRGLGDKVAENPELASLARVHRGAAAIKAARAQGMLGQYAAAADSLRVAVSQSPKDAGLRAEYVRMLGRAGKMTEAAAEAERLVADTNGSSEAIGLLVAVHRRSGHPERAVDIIRRLAVAQPDNIELWKVYIDALASAQRFDQAVAALHELTSRHPQATDSRWRLVQMTRERGEWAAWLQALAQHLKAHPSDSARVRAELERVPKDMAGRIVAQARSAGADRKLVPPVPDDAPTAAALDCLLAWLAQTTGDPQKAAAFLASAFKRAPDFLPATVSAVEQHVRACRWKEAVQAAKADPPRKATSAPLERLLGQAHDALDDIDAAAEHYRQAIDLDQNDIDSMIRLGQMHDRVGKAKDAERQLQFAVGTADNDMRAREALVRHFVQAGDEARAAQILAEMQRIAPHDPATVRSAAWTVMEFGTAEELKPQIEHLRGLVANAPQDARSREDLVEALLEAREYTAARDQALELDKQQPCSAVTGELLGKSHMSVLDYAAALRHVDRALSSFPNRESLLLLRAQAALVQPDHDTAIDSYKRLMELKHARRDADDYRGGMLMAYRQAGRFDDARTQVENWLKNAAADEAQRLRRYLLFIDVSAGDIQRYVTRCREWLKAEPENEELRTLLLGSSKRSGGAGIIDVLISPVDASRDAGLIGLGQHDEALILAIGWLDGQPEERPGRAAVLGRSLGGTARLLNIFLAAGRHAEAIEVARAAVSAAASPDERFWAQRMLFEVYQRARKNDEAVALARELAADASRDTFELNRELVALLSQAGRLDEAVTHANRLIGELEQQRERVAEMLARETNPQRRKVYREYVEGRSARQATVLRTLSYAYQRAGERQVAEQRLRDAYRLNPREIGVNNDLGYLMADAGKNMDEAERMVRQAIAEEPLTAAYQDSIGWVFYKKGQFEEARVWLTRATSLDAGQDPVVFDHLADTEWRLGQREPALEHWRESLRIQAEALREGSAEIEADLPGRVKAKLEAAAAGRNVPVAPTAAESQPAP